MKSEKNKSLSHLFSIDLPDYIRRDKDEWKSEYSERNMGSEEKWHCLESKKIARE